MKKQSTQAGGLTEKPEMDFTTSVEDKLVRKSRMELKELEAQEEQESGLVPRSRIQLSLRGDSKHPRA